MSSELFSAPEPVKRHRTLSAFNIGQLLGRSGTCGGHVRRSGLVEALDGGQAVEEAPCHLLKLGKGDATEEHWGMAGIKKCERQPCLVFLPDLSVFDGERNLGVRAQRLFIHTQHSRAQASVQSSQLGHLAGVGVKEPVIALADDVQ